MHSEHLLSLTSDHFDKLLLNQKSRAGGLLQCKESTQSVRKACLTAAKVGLYKYHIGCFDYNQQQPARCSLCPTPRLIRPKAF